MGRVRVGRDDHDPGADGVRRRLLGIAAELFRRKGFAQSTTRELAELLGLKKASLYYYVHSKQDLLYELCLESVRSIAHEVAAAVARHPGRRTPAARPSGPTSTPRHATGTCTRSC